MISIEGLSVRVGGFRLRVEHLEVGEGEHFMVMGPSGAGKTVFLRTLLGVYKPETGCICVDGADITGLPIEARGMALIPQGYALFPNMNVYGNIAFGLRIRGMGEREVEERVRRISQILGIGNLLGRMPAGLSGGERQRVALARALVINPKIVLMDEPLSNLDPRLRVKARRWLSQVRSRVGFTAIHATHNIVDAVVLGDRIAYLDGGRFLGVFTVQEFLETEHARPYLEDVDIGWR